jgi:ribosome maturation factor RimP
VSGEAASRLHSLLAPVVEECGLYLEDVTVGASGRRRLVRVTVDLADGPGGVGSDALADVSRAVSAALDDADPVPGTYVLEVSTPGIERPLTEPRHYRRAQGRIVHLRTQTGERLHGRLVAADGAEVVLVVGGSRRHLPYGELAQGRVEVELGAVEEVED